MEFLTIIFSSIVSIVFLFLICKLMGRKQISQLNFFDYVIGITIGSIASIVAVSDNYKILLYGLLSMGFYALFDIIISFFILKNMKFRKLLIGEAISIIENFKINYENMKKQKIDIHTLLSEARSNGYFDLSDVKHAYMEMNGRLSFIGKDEYLCHNLILDGELNKSKLIELGITEADLKRKFGSFENIILLTIDENKSYKLFKK